MSYLESFEKHYMERLGRMHISRLVECEENISRLIDSDLFADCILSDEITALYELIRNECIHRCQLSVGHGVGTH